MEPVRIMRAMKKRGYSGLFSSLSFAAITYSSAAAQPVCEPGQRRIVGQVVDAATEAPLDVVRVAAEASARPALTTSDGRFLLCEVGAGAIAITAERLGYETLTVDVVAGTANDPIRLRLRPSPILLDGLEIVMDRFKHRQRAVATVVRTYDEAAFASSGQWSAADFVASRSGIFTSPCAFGRCVYYRGTLVPPAIYLDERPLPGGWAQFESLPTSQLYMIEVYRRGTHVRAYSHAFMERAAQTRLAPLPITLSSRVRATGCATRLLRGRGDAYSGLSVDPPRSACPPWE
ncbi:MAG: carboxypeptidase-like regulatory domain-containing protein [Gemmatimonadetes bacterium]|nr:carboxypeptidase-like regulatory domain-containing protein [Gemmatimonadota bacterium]